MKRLVFIAILLISGRLQAVNVSGYVADAKTGETIIGVNILAEGTTVGATTDLQGFFIIRGLPRGKLTLQFSHIAHEAYRLDLDLSKNDLFLGMVTLQPAVFQGEAVEVTGFRGNLIQKDTDIASFEVDPVVLREVPQLNKDVFKLIKYSPSVTISDPLSPLYYVRGSDPGENLVQLDGMTIYNPQHTLSMAAIFNPYAVKNIEMLVGGFDAEFGGRNSSILYITSREGHRDEVHGEFRPSTSGLVGAVEFPAGARGTAMLSGRLLTSLESRILIGMPNLMVDLNGAYQVAMGNTRLRLSTFFARDFMDYDFARFSVYFTDPALKTYSTGFRTNTQNTALGLQTRSILNPNLVLETQFYHSGFRVDNKNFLKFSARDTVRDVDVVLSYETRIINAVSDLTGKANITYFSSLNQTFKLGYEGSLYRFFNDTGIYTSKALTTRLSSTLQSFFVQDKVEVGRFRLKLGLRNSHFAPSGRWRVEPRVSLTLNLEHATLKGAWGRYNQYITAMNTQDYELSQFLDYYYPLQGREPLSSTHYIIGLEGKVTDRIDYSATAYFKELNSLYRFDYNNTAGSIYAYRATLERGEGEAYGGELMVRGSLGALSGWISYAWSRSTRSYPSIQKGEPYLYDGDQTHNLKTVLIYKLTPDITGSTTFQFTSGFPKTWETGYTDRFSYDPAGNTVGIFPAPITPVKNNMRFPPRLSWEIGWKKKLRDGFGYRLAEYIGSDEAYYTMNVQNLLFLHRNPLMYFYIPDYGYYGYDFELFPIIRAGYSIRF